MHIFRQLLDMDEHAVLWPALTIHTRHIGDRDDVTVATHPALGLCIISHEALDSLVAWVTHRPIPDALTD